MGVTVMSAVHLRSWATTHPGMKRKHNEDAYVDRPDLGLWAVADGAGGHTAGEVASGMIADALQAIPSGLSAAELLSRVRALERRSGSKPKNVLEAGDLMLDIAAQRAFRDGTPLYLSLTEFRLLEVLARNRGQIVPRQAIITDVWGNRREVEDNTLDAYVRLLRKKIERNSQSKLIQTHRGLGYSMGLTAFS